MQSRCRRGSCAAARSWADLRRFSACSLIWPPSESPAPHPVRSRMRTMIWLPGKRPPRATCRRRGVPLRRMWSASANAPASLLNSDSKAPTRLAAARHSRGPSERINRSALDPVLIHMDRKVHVTVPTRACPIPTTAGPTAQLWPRLPCQLVDKGHMSTHPYSSAGTGLGADFLLSPSTTLPRLDPVIGRPVAVLPYRPTYLPPAVQRAEPGPDRGTVD